MTAVATTYRSAIRMAKRSCKERKRLRLMPSLQPVGSRRLGPYVFRPGLWSRAAFCADGERAPEWRWTRARRPFHTVSPRGLFSAQHARAAASGAREWQPRVGEVPVIDHRP